MGCGLWSCKALSGLVKQGLVKILIIYDCVLVVFVPCLPYLLQHGHAERQKVFHHVW